MITMSTPLLPFFAELNHIPLNAIITSGIVLIGTICSASDFMAITITTTIAFTIPTTITIAITITITRSLTMCILLNLLLKGMNILGIGDCGMEFNVDLTCLSWHKLANEWCQFEM